MTDNRIEVSRTHGRLRRLLMDFQGATASVVAVTILVICGISPAYGQDIPGAQDHPDFPRIAETRIVGFSYSDYAEGQFHSSTKNRSLNLESAEGELTRLMYMGPKSLSPLAVVRNYQAAFETVGEVQENFFCKDRDCFRNLGGAFIWAQARRLTTDLGVDRYLYHQPKYYADQVYWYGTITGQTAEYVVSVYAATRKAEDDFMARRKFGPGQVLVHLDVVKTKEFEAKLEYVEADQISTELSTQGHVTLEGIFFDFGSDVLTPASQIALVEIAKALRDDPALKVYVVGHTDNVGSLESNLDLSNRRAASVAHSLANDHGIASDRLVATGVGLVAPIASNETEEGRAQNRRVELVKR